jgi:hypothetical protein
MPGMVLAVVVAARMYTTLDLGSTLGGTVAKPGKIKKG